jgi:RimJ/RimL family protein N-acetyltransferase
MAPLPKFTLNPPPIETPRLILRPFVASDFDDVWAIRSDPFLMRWSRRGIPDTPDMAHERLDKWINVDPETANPSDRYTFGILEKDNPGRIIGMVGLAGMQPMPEVGYMIHAEFWGKGYASEALGGFMGAFWGLELTEGVGKDGSVVNGEEVKGGVSGEEESEYGICAATEMVNGRSNRVLEKNGFVMVRQWTEDGKVQILDWRAKRPNRGPRKKPVGEFQGMDSID